MTEKPHKIAREIAAKNTKETSRRSTNKNKLSQGELAAQAFEKVITAGLCASCARLAVDDSDHIGCSYEHNSPSQLANDIQSGIFLNELMCKGYLLIQDKFEIYTDENGVIRYRYK